MSIIYSTPCGMYRVVEQDGLFYPQERRVYAVGYGRLFTQQEVDETCIAGRLTVQQYPFEGWFLGYTCRGKSKGYKSYKVLKSATAFVDGCSQQSREGTECTT